MSQVLSIFQGYCNLLHYYRRENSLTPLQHKLYSFSGKFSNSNTIQFSVRDNFELFNSSQLYEPPNQAEPSPQIELNHVPHIQTLRKFPKDELFKKTVLVRFDSNITLQKTDKSWSCSSNTLSTIKYLHKSGAQIILITSWDSQHTSKIIAELLSHALELKVVPTKIGFHSQLLEESIILVDNLFQLKEDLSNSLDFAKKLSSICDIFVNDAFSQSHKILSSTVGIARFCSISMAGFHFEDCLFQTKKIINITKKSYFVIIGGGNLVGKGPALQLLTNNCDGLVFVGNIAFQIMHVLGLSVPLNLLQHGTLKEAFDLVDYAKSRNISIIVPKDFLCIKNDQVLERFEVFSAHSVLNGWVPIDLGPTSLDEITSLLSKCKKITWIGPVKFSSSEGINGTLILAKILNNLSQLDCEITVIGKMACKAVMTHNRVDSVSAINTIECASTVWEFLKGRKLPGLMALDRAYPFEIDWNLIYSDPTKPLVVDIGSGNGLFIFKMANKRKDLNFLGMEIYGKLVIRCLAQIHQSNIKNGHFIETNATSTFRSIVSTYPGELLLVTIQCPNPDFNKPEHRWRMLQKSLVETIADLLVINGKVFLQSDIESVAKKMKEEFMKYGKGKFVIEPDKEEGEWLKFNPFGVCSDWEQHVLDRGAPMYRLLLRKVVNNV